MPKTGHITILMPLVNPVSSSGKKRKCEENDKDNEYESAIKRIKEHKKIKSPDYKDFLRNEKIPLEIRGEFLL